MNRTSWVTCALAGLLQLASPTTAWSQGSTGSPCGGLVSTAATSPAKCQWQNFTRDPRAFATQPGGVCPIGAYRPGQYRILVGPTGPDGMTMPPPWWNSYGPYRFSKGDKWIAVLGWQSRLDRFEKNVGELLPYADPGARSAVYARNNDSSQWQAICIVSAAGAGGSGDGSADERCRHYADTALQQQRQNQARACGLSGDPWHGNLAEHHRWCLSVPAERSDAETAMRDEKLAACNGHGTSSGCGDYARTAVQQQEENLARRCGYTGAPWHSNYGEHFQWCQSVPAERSSAETAMRQGKLNECR